MLSNINPAMLILARETRGISQYELAAKIGVSQGKLSKAEKGEQSLPDDSFQSLLNALQYPKKFFFQETPSAPVSHYYYRKRITIPQRTIIQMESTIKVFRKNIDSLLDAIELPEFKLKSFKTDECSPENIAQKARHLLNVPKGPIKDLTNILENNGILVFKTDLFSDKIDGLSTISEKGAYIIFLNARMPNDRQRFSLSHELGHLLMHFDIPANENVEEEADRFASEFLMPKSEIINSLRFLNFPKLGDLKRYWRVSMKAIVRRAYDLKTINKNQYRNFQINFSKKGMSKSEPIPLPEEKPFILNEIVRLHIEELGYSKDELARVLMLNLDEFEERFIFHNRTKLKVIRNAG